MDGNLWMRGIGGWIGWIGAVGLIGCAADGQSASDGGALDAAVDSGTPWVSPFPDTGADGTWRMDVPGFCPRGFGLQAADLWSDQRGVYVLLSGDGVVDSTSPAANGQGGDVGECVDRRACHGETIWFTDGDTGWQRIHQRRTAASFSSSTRQLSGVGEDQFATYGTHGGFFAGEPACALGRFSADSWICDRQDNTTREGTGSAFFRVSATLAYASVDRDVVVFDGASWSVLGATPLGSIVSLWADATTLIAVDSDGVVARLRDSAWTTPFGELRVQSVWGNAPDDLWFVGPDATNVIEDHLIQDQQLVHFDGTRVSIVATMPLGSCGVVDRQLHLWGFDDTIYIYGDTSLYRWNGTQLRAFGNWACESGPSRITRVWGNAADEVFIALLNFDHQNDCGAAVVMYFDGNTFHAL